MSKAYKFLIIFFISFFFLSSNADKVTKNSETILTIKNPLFKFDTDNQQIRIKGAESYMNGSLEYLIHSPELELRTKGSLTEIKSLKAKFNQKLKIIEFQSSVDFHALANNGELKIKTDELIFHTKNKNATSSSKVLANINNLEVSSAGIDLIQEEGEFKAKFYKGNFQIEYPVSIYKGYADEITILVEQNKLILEGKAFFNQDGLIIRSDSLHYDLEKNKIIKSINSKIQNNT